MDNFETLKGKLKADRKGRLLLNGIPMILTPQWFFVNVQKELEKAGGYKLAKMVFYRAGYVSAYKYCKTQRETKGYLGTETIRRYLSSMSLRGWGRFKIVSLDEKDGMGIFRLYWSGFSEEYGLVKRTVCHWVPGAMAGAFQEIVDTHSLCYQIKGREVRCRSRGDTFCEFIVAPVRKKR